MPLTDQWPPPIADSCQDCRRALAGLWGGYDDRCQQCQARAVAGSLAAFNAMRQRDPDELRDELRRIFPWLTIEQSGAMVMAWWQHDHPRSPPRQSPLEPT